MHERDEVYEFGKFRLDVGAGTLTAAGEPVVLTPKVLATLVALVRSGGRVRSRDELMAEIWPDAVVTEANLSQNVWVLRQALGDGVDGARLIETVPRRGYRFLAPVTVVTVPAVGPDAGAGKGAVAEAPSGPGPDVVTPAPAVPAPAAPAVPAPAARPARRILGLAALVALCVAGAWAGWLGVTRLRAGRAESGPVRPCVAVLGFKDLGADPANGWLGTALSEMLDADLSAGGSLRLVPGESVSRLNQTSPLAGGSALAPETLARVRTALHADYAVTGSYVAQAGPGGRTLRLQVRLQDTVSGETLATHTETAPDGELFDLVTRTSAALRERLAVGTLTEAQRVVLRRTAPAAPDARRSYYEGLARLRAMDEKGAIAHLEAAVQREPDFAPAHAALAEAWAGLGFDVKAVEAARRATALSNGLPREEALLLEARAAEASRDWEKAEEGYGTLARFFPDDLEYALRLANAQVERGQGAQALATLERARSLGARHGGDPRVDLAEAKAAESVSDFERAAAAADRALARATRLGSDVVAARALMWKGVAAARRSQQEAAIPLFTEAGRLFRKAGDRLGAARAANGLANVVADKGDLDSARLKYEEALTVAEEAGQKRLAATVLNNLGILAKDRGDLAASLRAYERALVLARECGNPVTQALVLGNRGVALRNLGRLSEARRSLEEALALHRGAGDRGGACGTLVNLSDTELRAGDLAASAAHAREAIAIARETGNPGDEAGAMEGLAEVVAWGGRLDEAVDLARKAVAIREEHGQAMYGAEARSTLASILSLAGKWEEAAAAAREAAALFERERERDAETLARARLSRALTALGRLDEAEAALRRARELSAVAPQSRWSAGLAEAQLETARGRSAAAAGAARTVADEARRTGALPYELEARLVAARIGPVPGAPAGETPAALAEEARRKGFDLIASRAASGR